MKILYKKIDSDILNNYSRIELKNLQSEYGKSIVEYVGKNIYKIPDTKIIIKNNKPRFQNSNIEFSITHSEAIVLVAFDEFPIGVDVEYMKARNFESFVGRYGITATDKIGFYRQWTELEAKFKLHNSSKWVYNQIFEKDYMFTIVSTQKQIRDISIEQIFNNY